MKMFTFVYKDLLIPLKEQVWGFNFPMFVEVFLFIFNRSDCLGSIMVVCSSPALHSL